ncbi:conserved Plasmodium protein, unknown function [Plasmodium ovale wallikeri]|uniref:Uncharacterized protein n=1 Tax=Plasmodium ovale wallikeri TaxID=864142 RepID=A0A1A8YNE5_PLAOA|nr:conserved Plasmodium protein, unknown function [Plasmodium ovale wallikeri]SBT33459.1 conserved Plasmodium protein, unknown function [Plasmodium ovale wallikeri]
MNAVTECPPNLFTLYFLKPFVSLSEDKIQVVRMTWQKCLFSQFQKKGHLTNIPGLLAKLNEMNENIGNVAISKSDLSEESNSNNSCIKTFDVQDLDS